MKANFNSIVQILDYYNDKDKCIKLLEQQRWPHGVTCPHCGNEKVYKTNRGYKCADKNCLKKFSVTVKTIFENSKIPLRIWFAAIHVATAHKKGISSHQLARDLGITQKSAWFVLHRIREMLKDNDPALLGGITEIDETFVGGKARNRHKSKQDKINESGISDKTIVLGLLERDGKVKTQIVKDITSETLIPIILKNVTKGSIMVTDDHGGYNPLSKDYFHESVKHSTGEYVRGRLIHSNGIENYWSLLKRGIIGIYHQVSAKHLGAYCTEFNYRFNTRKISDTQRFHLVLKQTEKRLKYADLIANKEDFQG